jgi:hypothetical protein
MSRSGSFSYHCFVTLTILLLGTNGLAQSTPGPVTLIQRSDLPEATSSWSLSAAVSTVAIPPRRWVNQHECDGTATVTKLVCHQGDSQCPNSPGDYDTTSAGLRQALLDAENLRLSSDVGSLLKISVGADIKVKGNAGTIRLRNLGYTGTRCIVIDSSNPLPPGVRVGSIAVASISRDASTGTVVTRTATPHGLHKGDVVEIQNVTGSAINFNGLYSVTVIDPLTFGYFQEGPTEAGIVTPMLTVMTGPNTLAQQKAANLYALETISPNVPVLATDPGAHHYVFYDGEVFTSETTVGQAGPIVIFGPQPPAVTFAGNGSHIGFDRMYVHGCAGTVPTAIPLWPQPVPCGPQDAGLKSGVRLNCSFCWVVYSFFDQMQMPGIESHTLGTYDGQGPFKIVNNRLRGAATGLHFGNTPPTIPGLVPSDIEVRLNKIDLDPNWFAVSHATCGGTTGKKWGLKSRLDFENVRRLVFEGNEVYQSWCDGDAGELIYMSPAACSKTGCTGGNQAVISDIYFANNLMAHSYHLFFLGGRSGNAGSGNGVSLPFQRMDVINNLAWDLAVPGYGIGPTKEISLGPHGQTYTCNAMRTGGIATLNGCTCLQTNCPWTGISTGDWVLAFNCTDPSFNTTRTPALFSRRSTNGPISYANGGPDTASAVSCSLGNEEGFPRFLNFRHNTFVANTNSSGISFVNNGSGPIGYFPRNFTLVDSISSNDAGTSVSVGWRCNALPDGSRSTRSGKCWDTSSLNFHHFVAQGRGPIIDYSEYRNGIELFPAMTLAFPSVNACNGSFSAGCLGYVGDFASPNPADYHDLALCDGVGDPAPECSGASAYAGAAHDGTDIGVNLQQLDAARVKLQFNSNSYPQ